MLAALHYIFLDKYAKNLKVHILYGIPHADKYAIQYEFRGPYPIWCIPIYPIFFCGCGCVEVKWRWLSSAKSSGLPPVLKGYLLSICLVVCYPWLGNIEMDEQRGVAWHKNCYWCHNSYIKCNKGLRSCNWRKKILWLDLLTFINTQPQFFYVLFNFYFLSI